MVKTDLHIACINGNAAAVERHLKQNPEWVHEKNDLDCTPLHDAAYKGHEQCVRLLLAGGADPKARGWVDRTPLHWAARCGHEQCVRLLLAGGADPKARDKDGKTPLDWARQFGHSAVVELLEGWGREQQAEQREGQQRAAADKQRREEEAAAKAKVKREAAKKAAVEAKAKAEREAAEKAAAEAKAKAEREAAEKAAAEAKARAEREAAEKAGLAGIYATRHVLNFDHRIVDGFLDAGRGRAVRPLSDWRRDAMVPGGREVLLVDVAALAPLLQSAREAIAHLTSDREVFAAIAKLCSDELGGASSMRDVRRTDERVAAIKRELNSNVVPLHRLCKFASSAAEASGVCRHRAVLFKTICDNLTPPHNARLVRGDYEDASGGGGHAWNVVLVGDSLYLCDVMHQPGHLYHLEKDEEKVDHYKRLQLGGGRGGVAAHSVPVPPAAVHDGEIHLNELELGRYLGKGGFGVVHQAKWRGSLDVAVKKIKPELLQGMSADDAKKDFAKEIETLSRLRWPNIVLFLGGRCEGTEYFVVTELMELGSLNDCMRTHPAEYSKWGAKGRKVLHDASKGLVYLHMQKPDAILHLDIKPLNVLVNADGVGKLGDVGLTKHLERTVTMPAGWTPSYAAPEVMSRKGANEKSDVYSFGLMVLEVFTGRAPSMFGPNNVPTGSPVEPILNGVGAAHGGALNDDKAKRPTAVQLERGLQALLA